MKYLLLAVVIFSSGVHAQSSQCENIFIITTDGFRWQELFNGADERIVFNPEYVSDTSLMRYNFWAGNALERRKKLMPFVWNYISTHGQIWGNRMYGNEVSVENPYRLSYAGYNEIFTGYADRAVISNRQRNNQNTNLLTYLDALPEYKNKVASFGSWKLFECILNGTENKIPLNAGYQKMQRDSLSIATQLTNALQEGFNQPTRSDLLTFVMATEYIQANHPKIVHIGFGETDEFAHQGKYDRYLAQANLFDKFLADLWTMIQSDDFYKNKTTLFITTDHGRGRKPGKWNIHGPLVAGSDETWMMQLGPNIFPLGEVKQKISIQNEQFAQTIATYLGKTFTADHPVAEAAAYLLHPLASVYDSAPDVITVQSDTGLKR